MPIVLVPPKNLTRNVRTFVFYDMTHVSDEIHSGWASASAGASGPATLEFRVAHIVPWQRTLPGFSTLSPGSADSLDIFFRHTALCR